MKYVDLHVHTYLSDGTFSPQEVLCAAKTKGLSAIAITDHDTIDGISPSLALADKYAIEVIPGVELTSETVENEVHILGLFIDYRNEAFQAKLREIAGFRRKRAVAIIKKLNEVGANITLQDVLQEGCQGTIGRLHIAKALLKRGYISNISEAFHKYIGEKDPCYVKMMQVSPCEAIKLIRDVQGLSFLAHPHLLGKDDLISEFIRCGLNGIEVHHTDHPNSAVARYKKMAEERGLLITGGSDCHGEGKGKVLLGKVLVEYEVLERLKEAHRRILHAQGA